MTTQRLDLLAVIGIAVCWGVVALAWLAGAIYYQSREPTGTDPEQCLKPVDESWRGVPLPFRAQSGRSRRWNAGREGTPVLTVVQRYRRGGTGGVRVADHR